MLREMEKPREQGNSSIVEKSNLFQWERGIGRVNGLNNKGRIGIRNNQSNELIGNSIVEQNICNKETGRRIEENNGQSAVEYIAKIPTFYNERSEYGTGNVEIKRLGMPDGHQISVQSCSSNGRTGEIPCIHTQRSSLYASGNAIWDLDSTEDFRKDNINSNRQDEEQESSSYNKLRRRHSISNEGSGITWEGNGVDSRGIYEIWMDNQREEEQAETGVTVCIPGVDVQFNNNEDLIDQREKEGIESTSSKTDKVNNGRKSTKIKSMASLVGKLRFSTPQFKRGGLHLQQINKQMSKTVRELGWTSEMIVTRKCLTELYWWVTQLENNKPRMIDKRQREIIIQTDASIIGWRASVIKNNTRVRRIYGQWEASMENSNLREILAICRSIQSLKEYINQQEYS
ncbi:MAG: hypothetical protein EZS28_036868 [Streblomastix strix]|uniref:Uncharacterized protein n=1 Tax=Streblomastix strix TaxID=222440 RepID=A0A5J4UBK7_9EUKA|nr:MAG: hypothetical protein EZS28_036868 [Streblomastix strix]